MKKNKIQIILKCVSYFLSIILTFIILFESTLDVSTSALKSNFFSKSLANIVNVVSGGKRNDVAPSKIVIDEDFTIHKYEHKNLKCEVLPLNSSHKSLAYISSDEKILSISKTGEMIALKEGNVRITVVINEPNYYDVCSYIDIKVLEPKIDSLNVIMLNTEKKDDVYLVNKGKTKYVQLNISPSYIPFDAVKLVKEYDDIDIYLNSIYAKEYSSSVHTLGFYYNGKKVASLKYKIVPLYEEEPVSIISEDSLNLEEGDYYYLDVKLDPFNTKYEYLLTSLTDNIEIENNYIHALKEGEGQVLISTSTSSKIVNVNVTSLPFNKIKFIDEITLYKGESLYVPLLKDFDLLDNKIFNFETSSSSLIYEEGFIKGEEEGDYSLIISKGNEEKRINVKIIDGENIYSLDCLKENIYLEKENNNVIDLNNIFNEDNINFVPLNTGIIINNNKLTINNYGTYAFLASDEYLNKKIVFLHILKPIKYNIENNNFSYTSYASLKIDEGNTNSLVESSSFTITKEDFYKIYSKDEKSGILNIIPTYKGKRIEELKKECNLNCKTIPFTISNFKFGVNYNDEYFDLSQTEENILEIKKGYRLTNRNEGNASSKFYKFYLKDKNNNIQTMVSSFLKVYKAKKLTLVIEEISSSSKIEYPLHFVSIFSIDESSPLLIKGDKVEFKDGKYVIQNGSNATVSLNYLENNQYRDVDFKSSSNNVAIVDANGVITPRSKGKTTIDVIVDDKDSINKTYSFEVEVEGKGLIIVTDKMKLIIRKIIGHFGLFFALGMFVTLGIFISKRKDLILKSTISLYYGLLISCLSEVLQPSDKGRYTELSDVFIDYLGYALAFFLVIIILFLINYFNNKKDKKKIE